MNGVQGENNRTRDRQLSVYEQVYHPFLLGSASYETASILLW